MALNPSVTYSGQTEAPDATYPYGGCLNESDPGQLDGTPFERALVNDIFGLQQALLVAMGTVPSGASDGVGASQYLQAIVGLASGKAKFYTSSGDGVAYVFTAASESQAPAAYFEGMRVTALADLSNTGAATVDVAGLGAVSIRRDRSTPATELRAGDIQVGRLVELEYSVTSNAFFLVTNKLVEDLGNTLRPTGFNNSLIRNLATDTDTSLLRGQIGDTVVKTASDTQATDLTIPADGATPDFGNGDVIAVYNISDFDLNILGATGVTLRQLTGSGSNTGSRVLAAGGSAYLHKIDADSWVIAGLGVA